MTIDTGGFMGAMQAAADYIGSGEGTDAALRGELGKVLQRCVDYTHSPEADDLRRRSEIGVRKKFNTYAAGEIGQAARRETPRISFCPGTGKAWWIDQGGQGSNTKYLMNGGKRRHWGNRFERYQAEEADRLADLAAELQQYLPKIDAARGLTKRSWYEIGQALGIEVPGVPGWVKAAVATDRKNHLNGDGKRTATADSLRYELQNHTPMLINPRRGQEGLMGEGILQRAFNSRESAIMIGLEKGIFDDLEKAAKRFPGLVLVR